MSVSRYRPASDGRAVNILHAQKKASTVIEQDELLSLDANGFLIPAVITSLNIVGASLTSIIATDDNYADTDEIQYDGALEGDEFIMAVDDASTAGFKAGVTRAILDSKTVKAAVDAGNPNFVVVKKVLLPVSDNLAVVSFLTNAA